MENMPAVHMEEQQCPLAKCWLPHMHMGEGNHSALLWRNATGKAERKRANRSLPVPNPPPTPGKSQAIQHLQVKLLRIATVTKLGDLHPKPVPPKSCRSRRAVREGKEKHLTPEDKFWNWELSNIKKLFLKIVSASTKRHQRSIHPSCQVQGTACPPLLPPSTR